MNDFMDNVKGSILEQAENILDMVIDNQTKKMVSLPNKTERDEGKIADKR